MASKTINPTRMELTRLKGRLRTAVRGHRLLKDKRDELMRQFFLIVRENKELRAKVEQGIAEANRAMTVASSVMSPEMLQQALLYPKQSATLDMTFQNIMSVSVPVYEFHTKNEDAASIYPLRLRADVRRAGRCAGRAGLRISGHACAGAGRKEDAAARLRN